MIKKARLLLGLCLGASYLCNIGVACFYYASPIPGRTDGTFFPDIEIFNNKFPYIDYVIEGKTNKEKSENLKKFYGWVYEYIFGHDMVTGESLSLLQEWRKKETNLALEKACEQQRKSFCQSDINYSGYDFKDWESVKQKDLYDRISAYIRMLMATFINSLPENKTWVRKKYFKKSIECMPDLAVDAIVNDCRKYQFDQDGFYDPAYRNGYGVQLVLRHSFANIQENYSKCLREINNGNNNVVGEQDVCDDVNCNDGDSYLNLYSLNRWLSLDTYREYENFSLKNPTEERPFREAFEDVKYINGVISSALLRCCFLGVLQEYSRNFEKEKNIVEKHKRRLISCEQRLKELETLPSKNNIQNPAQNQKTQINTQPNKLKKLIEELRVKIDTFKSRNICLQKIQKWSNDMQDAEPILEDVRKVKKILTRIMEIDNQNRAVLKNFSGGENDEASANNITFDKEKIDIEWGRKIFGLSVVDKIIKDLKNRGNPILGTNDVLKILDLAREHVPDITARIKSEFNVANETTRDKAVTYVDEMNRNKLIGYFEYLNRIKETNEFKQEVIEACQKVEDDYSKKNETFLKKIVTGLFYYDKTGKTNKNKKVNDMNTEFRNELQLKVRKAYFNLCHDIQIYLHDTGFLDTSSGERLNGVLQSAYELVNNPADVGKKTTAKNTIKYKEFNKSNNPEDENEVNELNVSNVGIRNENNTRGKFFFDQGNGNYVGYIDQSHSENNIKNGNNYSANMLFGNGYHTSTGDSIINISEKENENNKGTLSGLILKENTTSALELRTTNKTSLPRVKKRNEIMTPGIFRKAAVMFCNMNTQNSNIALSQYDSNSRAQIILNREKIWNSISENIDLSKDNYISAQQNSDNAKNMIELLLNEYKDDRKLCNKLNGILSQMKNGDQAIKNLSNSISNLNNGLNLCNIADACKNNTINSLIQTLYSFLVIIPGLDEDGANDLILWAINSKHEYLIETLKQYRKLFNENNKGIKELSVLKEKYLSYYNEYPGKKDNKILDCINNYIDAFTINNNVVCDCIRVMVLSNQCNQAIQKARVEKSLPEEIKKLEKKYKEELEEKTIKLNKRIKELEDEKEKLQESFNKIKSANEILQKEKEEQNVNNNHNIEKNNENEIVVNNNVNEHENVNNHNNIDNNNSNNGDGIIVITDPKSKTPVPPAPPPPPPPPPAPPIVLEPVNPTPKQVNQIKTVKQDNNENTENNKSMLALIQEKRKNLKKTAVAERAVEYVSNGKKINITISKNNLDNAENELRKLERLKENSQEKNIDSKSLDDAINKITEAIEAWKKDKSTINPSDKNFLQKALSNAIRIRRKNLHLHDDDDDDDDEDSFD